jgi:STE24 endopeptidase
VSVSPNGYFWLVLISLAGFYALDSAVSWLNVRALKPSLPDEFREIYDEEEYRRFLKYTATTARFEWIENTFNFVLLLAFWFCGGYQLLDHFVRSAQLGPITSGLCYMGALWLGHWLINLPFEVYGTFIIEQRFGFNKMTPLTFASDSLKSLILSGLLGGSLLVLILAIFERGGPWVWLPAWIVTSALLILFVFIAPAIILPLFNKFTPLAEGELKSAILRYGEEYRFPIGGVFVMDGSRRSTKANAFFTGFGKTKKIVLFDTLVSNHTTDELVAVLAHEIGHYKHRHIVQHLVVAVLNIGVFLFLASMFMHSHSLFEAFGVRNPSIYAGLALFLVFYNPLSRLLSVARGVQSRRHEFQADWFAARTTHHPQAMIEALKKLSKNNLSNLSPHPLYVILYHSHPPVLQRIKALHSSGL